MWYFTAKTMFDKRRWLKSRNRWAKWEFRAGVKIWTLEVKQVEIVAEKKPHKNQH